MDITFKQALGQNRYCADCGIKFASHEPCVERNGIPYHHEHVPMFGSSGEVAIVRTMEEQARLEMAVTDGRYGEAHQPI